LSLFFSILVDINEFSHQISDINEKIDYVITNIKQINTINKFQLNNGLSTTTTTQQNELTNDNNNNISLSSNMFKSLMQCKQCLEQFSLTQLPKRAIKCGHSICSKCFGEEIENEEQKKNNNNNQQNDINNETILINCSICNLKSIWTNNLDLITILQEVHRNKMDNFIKDIIKINSSKLSENYSNNFKDLIKIALNDFDKLSSDSQILIYNIIKRKYNKECQINANPSNNNKRPRFN
jgi:hypothetical protein